MCHAVMLSTLCLLWRIQSDNSDNVPCCHAMQRCETVKICCDAICCGRCYAVMLPRSPTRIGLPSFKTLNNWL